MLVRIRKLGRASPSAIGARKNFNPLVARHSWTMRSPRPGSSQLSCHNQTEPGVGDPSAERFGPLAPGGWSSVSLGRLDREAGVEQPPMTISAACAGSQDLRRKIAGAEQVDEHVLGGELAHGLLPAIEIDLAMPRGLIFSLQLFEHLRSLADGKLCLFVLSARSLQLRPWPSHERSQP